MNSLTRAQAKKVQDLVAKANEQLSGLGGTSYYEAAAAQAYLLEALTKLSGTLNAVVR